MPHDLAKIPWNAMKNCERGVVQENIGIDRLEELMKQKRDQARIRGETGPVWRGGPTPLLRAGSEVTLAGMRQRLELNGRKAEVLTTGEDVDGFVLVSVEGAEGSTQKQLRVRPRCLFEANEVKPLLEGLPSDQSALSIAVPSVPASLLSAMAPASSVAASSMLAPPVKSKLSQFEAWDAKYAERKAKSAPTGCTLGLEKIHTGTWNVAVPGKRTHGWAGF
eukprot:TRINITY_DN48775_c0_g1_i1.p1 TRINITY_DN48775_c0_g1~~TRINITY_DN48775_c0_g1_i1.p1  ORF type:complete len:221 (-),score=46.14 TRINITY_DN48775_c0_g1_i1:11-673(-)